MRMRLEHDRAGPHDFPPLAALIARRAHLIKTTMRNWQELCLRQCSLTGSLSRAIHIDDGPRFFRPVEHATRRGKRLAGQQIFLKERAESFDGALVEGGKKTRKRRAMGQPMATKQSHEWLGKWQKPFVKSEHGGFAGKSIADQDGDEIDQVVVTKARAGETYLPLDRFQDACMREHLSKSCHFSQPWWDRRNRFRSNLH